MTSLRATRLLHHGRTRWGGKTTSQDHRIPKGHPSVREISAWLESQPNPGEAGMGLSGPKCRTRRLVLLSLLLGLWQIHTRVLLCIHGRLRAAISFTWMEIKEEKQHYYQPALPISFPSAFLPFGFHDDLISSSFSLGGSCPPCLSFT